ncbi:phage tail sheath family protein [Agrobacterium fabrum]|uniref:phage tail tape measure protein n=1 Tax=Agrobacterium fabrum TaxID=1176649 RepID=UPI00000D17FD
MPQAAALGAAGTLLEDVTTIFNEGGSWCIVNRVPESADAATLQNNLIGDPVARTGLYAALRAKAITSYQPRVLITAGDTGAWIEGGVVSVSLTSEGDNLTEVPDVTATGGGADPGKVLPTLKAIMGTGPNAKKVVGVEVVAPGKKMSAAPLLTFTGGGADAGKVLPAATANVGDVANPFVSALNAITPKIRARAYITGPNTTDAEALRFRKTVNGGRILIIDPKTIKNVNGVPVTKPVAPVFAGVRSRVVASAEGFSGSVSNKIIRTIDGVARTIAYTGGMKEFMNDLGDLLLGPVDPNAADRIGAIFMRAKEWGASIRELNDAIKDNPIAKFFAEMSGYGFQLFAWGMGISMLAGTIRKLAAALFVLSGASTLLGALKTVGSIAAIVGGGAVAGGAAAGAGTGSAGAAAGGAATAGLLGRWGSIITGLARIGTYGTAGAGLWEMGKATYTGDTFYKQGKAWLPGPEDLLHAVGSYFASSPPSTALPASASAQLSLDAARSARAAGFGGSTDNLPGKTMDDLGIRTVRIDSSSLAQMDRPSGTQDVRVVNPQRPDITIHAPITITGVVDPRAAASAAISEISNALAPNLEGSFSD